MNKLILATVLISAVLAGCGSGGSSSSSSSSSGSSNASVTYKWQIVQLESVTEGDVKSGCVIYANSESNTGEVITANVATSGYNILYHNADGSIASTTPSDDITGGAVTIAKSDVPDDGYVSLEEVYGLNSNSADVYIFSVQKSLLTNLVLNVRYPQLGGCYAGDDYRKVSASGSAAISVLQKPSIEYYQTSYDNSSVSGNILSADIQVVSPISATHDTLVTAFANYDAGSTQKTDLEYWGFIDSDYIYDSSNNAAVITSARLNSEDLINLYWNTTDDVILDKNGAVIAIHGGINYFWQPIYDVLASNKLTIASGNPEVSQWSAYFSGKENDVFSWLFESYIPLNNKDINLFIPELLTVGGVNIAQTCTDSQSEFCVNTDSSFSSDDFTLQRTQIQMTSVGNNEIYQSIYTEPSASPVILVNSQFDITNPALDRIELNLISSDAATSNALHYLMAQSMDVMGIAEKSSVVDKFSDANGFVATPAKSDELHKAMLASTTMTVKNAHDFN